MRRMYVREDEPRRQPRATEVPPVSNDRPGTKGVGPIGIPDSDRTPVKNPKNPIKGGNR